MPVLISRLIVFCLVGCFSFTLLAQEPTAKPENPDQLLQPEQAPKNSLDPNEPATVDDIEADTVPFRPLSEIRAQKSFGVSLRYGQVIGSIPGTGIDFFYQLKPHLQVGMTHLAGALDLKNSMSSTDGTTMEKNQLRGNLSLIYGRHFFGESFFVTGALGQRFISSKYSIRSTTANSFIDANNATTSVVAHVAIGNMWTWEKGFYAGIDWLGFSQPLSSNENINVDITGSDVPPTALNDKKKATEEPFRKIAKRGTPLFLTFHFGYTF